MGSSERQILYGQWKRESDSLATNMEFGDWLLAQQISMIPGNTCEHPFNQIRILSVSKGIERPVLECTICGAQVMSQP